MNYSSLNLSANPTASWPCMNLNNSKLACNSSSSMFDPTVTPRNKIKKNSICAFQAERGNVKYVCKHTEELNLLRHTTKRPPAPHTRTNINIQTNANIQFRP